MIESGLHACPQTLLFKLAAVVGDRGPRLSELSWWPVEEGESNAIHGNTVLCNLRRSSRKMNRGSSLPNRN